jgi:hypothetical protein
MTARIKRTMPVPEDLVTRPTRTRVVVIESRSRAWQRAAIVGGVLAATIAIIWLARSGSDPLDA